MTEVRPGWREALEADPLNLASHRPWDEPARPPDARRSPKGDLIRLAVTVAAIIAFGFAIGHGETVLLVIALVICIVAHEFGHFVMARAAGVKVTEFFVGFGPRLWSVRRGETEYGVKALPLGGYCRIIGMTNLEDVDPADEARTYRQAPLLRRLSIDVAGSAMHFLIAILILFTMFFWTGDKGFYLSAPSSNPVVEITKLQTGLSPAQVAGLQLRDRVLAVDGKTFSWDALGNYIRANPGKRLDFTVERAGHIIHLFPVPVKADTLKIVNGQGAPSGPVGFVGFAVSPLTHSGFGSSLSHAGGAFVQVSAGTLKAFGRLVSLHGVSSYVHMLSDQKAADNPNNNVRFRSPVGTVQLLNQAAESGLAIVLWLVAVINISLGILNLLPIFPLDGGRVAVALYEGVRSWRRPYRADIAKLLPFFYLGLALIVFLGASALFLDLRDLATHAR